MCPILVFKKSYLSCDERKEMNVTHKVAAVRK